MINKRWTYFCKASKSSDLGKLSIQLSGWKIPPLNIYCFTPMVLLTGHDRFRFYIHLQCYKQVVAHYVFSPVLFWKTFKSITSFFLYKQQKANISALIVQIQVFLFFKLQAKVSIWKRKNKLKPLRFTKLSKCIVCYCFVCWCIMPT